ncbi:glycosyltransferase [Isosphaeraceae bacterium EP7]
MSSPDPGDSILLVLPIPFRRDLQGRLFLEAQACNGLRRWADHFGRVVAACPVAPMPVGDSASERYLPLDSVVNPGHIDAVELPGAYTLRSFASQYRQTRTQLAGLIRRSGYLSFAIGGLFGDWAAVAALEADRQGRGFSVWTDRVEHKVTLGQHLDSRGLKRIYRGLKNRLVISPLMKALEHHVISRSALGLFHGRDCYEAYAPHCRSPHLVHDIHLGAEDRIPGAELAEKLARARMGLPLRITYAGRATAMKGPLDWVRTLANLRDRGVAYKATWLGDGPMLPDMKQQVDALGLADLVEFRGFVSDREEILKALRASDLFLFCHKTPESPRCLIEALVAGTPIVGYTSHYAADLLEEQAGQLLVPLDDVDALASTVAGLDADRPRLARIMGRCDDLGSHFSDTEVFRHRSDLIRSEPATAQDEVIRFAGSRAYANSLPRPLEVLEHASSEL